MIDRRFGADRVPGDEDHGRINEKHHGSARPRANSKVRRRSSFRIVTRDIGALQLVLSVTMLVPALVSVVYAEVYSALSFLAAAAVTATFGALAYRTCRTAGDPDRTHALLIAGAGWFVSALFGALPFLFAAHWTPHDAAQALVPAGESYTSSLEYFRNPLHAFFESMSAYTTTGLTMAVHEPSIGHGLLLYRSLAQWIGGAGVIVLSLAIIPRPHVAGVLELYQSEAAGTKLRPSILGTARAIWKIYAGLTLLVALYLFVATLIILPDYGVWPSLFDALNHAMTGQSTGGFSTLDDSIAEYGSYAMEMIHVPPMILGAVSIPLYYAFFRDRTVRVFWQDAQFRSMLILFAVATPALVLLLQGSSAVADPLRESFFQIISAVSTTGWQTSDIGNWSNSAVVLMAWGTMVVGGAAGATVGGIKLIRGYLLFQSARWRLRKALLPGEAVVPFRVGARNLHSDTMRQEVADASTFSFMFVLIIVVSITIVAYFAGPEFSLADVIFECISAQSTVGLSSGITDPSMSPVIETVFILQMWAGRLEIFPVIVVFTSLFTWTRR
jgi:trk system potassium uptake protein